MHNGNPSIMWKCDLWNIIFYPLTLWKAQKSYHKWQLCPCFWNEYSTLLIHQLINPSSSPHTHSYINTCLHMTWQGFPWLYWYLIYHDRTSCVSSQSGACASCPSLTVSEHPCGSDTCQCVSSDPTWHTSEKRPTVGKCEAIVHDFCRIFALYKKGILTCLKHMRMPHTWHPCMSICCAHVANGLCQSACWAERWDTVPSAARPGVRKPTQEHTWLGTTRQHSPHPPTQSHADTCLYSTSNCDIIMCAFAISYILLKKLWRTQSSSFPLSLFSPWFTNNLLFRNKLSSFIFLLRARPGSFLKKKKNCSSTKGCDYATFSAEITRQQVLENWQFPLWLIEVS